MRLFIIIFLLVGPSAHAELDPVCKQSIQLGVLDVLSSTRIQFLKKGGSYPPENLFPPECTKLLGDKLKPNLELDQVTRARGEKNREEKIKFQKDLVQAAYMASYLVELRKAAGCIFIDNPLAMNRAIGSSNIQTYAIPVQAASASPALNERCEKIWAWYNGYDVQTVSAADALCIDGTNTDAPLSSPMDTQAESQLSSALQVTNKAAPPKAKDANLIKNIEDDLARIIAAYPMLSSSLTEFKPSTLMNDILAKGGTSIEQMSQMSPIEVQTLINRDALKTYEKLNTSPQFHQSLRSWYDRTHSEILKEEKALCSGEDIESYFVMEDFQDAALLNATALYGKAGGERVKACTESILFKRKVKNIAFYTAGGIIGVASVGMFGAGLVLGPAVAGSSTLLAVGGASTVIGIGMGLDQTREAYREQVHTKALLFAGLRSAQDLSDAQRKTIQTGILSALDIVGGAGDIAAIGKISQIKKAIEEIPGMAKIFTENRGYSLNYAAEILDKISKAKKEGAPVNADYEALTHQIPNASHADALAFKISDDVEYPKHHPEADKEQFYNNELRTKAQEKELALHKEQAQKFRDAYNEGEFTEADRYISIYTPAMELLETRRTVTSGGKYGPGTTLARVEGWVVQNKKKFLKVTEIDRDGSTAVELLSEADLARTRVDPNSEEAFKKIAAQPVAELPDIMPRPEFPISVGAAKPKAKPSVEDLGPAPLKYKPDPEKRKFHTDGFGREIFAKKFEAQNLPPGTLLQKRIPPDRGPWVYGRVEGWEIKSGQKELRVTWEVPDSTGAITGTQTGNLTQADLDVTSIGSGRLDWESPLNKVPQKEPTAFELTSDYAQAKDAKEVKKFRDSYNSGFLDEGLEARCIAFVDPKTNQQFLGRVESWVIKDGKRYLEVTRKNVLTSEVDRVVLSGDALETARIYRGAYQDRTLNPAWREPTLPPINTVNEEYYPVSPR